jgi:hypothetical protein
VIGLLLPLRRPSEWSALRLRLLVASAQPQRKAIRKSFGQPLQPDRLLSDRWKQLSVSPSARQALIAHISDAH